MIMSVFFLSNSINYLLYCSGLGMSGCHRPLLLRYKLGTKKVKFVCTLNIEYKQTEKNITHSQLVKIVITGT